MEECQRGKFTSRRGADKLSGSGVVEPVGVSGTREACEAENKKGGEQKAAASELRDLKVTKTGLT